jgi:hypothetical protein
MKTLKRKIIDFILRKNEWRYVIDNVDKATEDLMTGKITEGHFTLVLPNKYSGFKSKFNVSVTFKDIFAEDKQ